MIRFSPEQSASHPVGYNIVYKCEKCGSILPSIPDTEYIECACNNLSIDKAAGRFSIEDPSQMSYYLTDAAPPAEKTSTIFGKLLSKITK